MTQLLSITEAAARLSCSRGHIYNLIAVGELAAVEIKALGQRPKTRVLDDELEEFIERHTRRASTGGGRSEDRRIDGT